MSTRDRAQLAFLPLLLAAAAAAAAPRRDHLPPNRPLLFEENRTQTDPRVSFIARGSQYVLFLTRDEAVLRAGAESPSVVRMRFENANPAAAAEGIEELAARTRYLVGPRESHLANVRNFSRVRYRNLWPGIDAVFHGTRGSLEYDFELKPGADPARIRLRFSGAALVRRNDAGDLLLATPSGEVRWRKPAIYQAVGSRRETVAGEYALLDANLAGFRIGPYDRSRPLVIDPVLSFASYHAGNGLDSVNAIAVDDAGSVYLAGSTTSDLRFPDGSNLAPLRARQTGSEAFVTKLAADGRTLQWWTYYGGGSEDTARALAVDASHKVYLAGTTRSADLPLNQAVQTKINTAAADAYVARFDASGSQLLMATYLGGDSAETVGGLAVDASGYAYVAGQTFSANFPVTVNAFQSQRKGPADGFLAVLDTNGAGFPPTVTSGFGPFVEKPAGALLYSSYLGGDDTDAIRGLAIDTGTPGVTDGQRVPLVYVAGESLSTTGLPVSPSAYQRQNRGGSDAFVATVRWNERSAPAQVVYCTYLGSSGNDAAYGISVQPGSGLEPKLRRGVVYVTGTTAGVNFPAFSAISTIDTQLPAAYRSLNDPSGDAFVTVLDTNATASLALLYSVYLGGDSLDIGRRIQVAPSTGFAYVFGETASQGGKPFPLTLDAYQIERRGTGDAFLTVLDPFAPNLPGLLYSTLYGGGGVEQASALAVDAQGHTYLGGGTSSRDLPVANARQAAVPDSNAGAGFYARFQMGCTFTLVNPANTLDSSGGAAGSFQVAPSDSSCQWRAVAAASWLAITQGGSLTPGPGSVSYTADANSTLGSPARSGLIHVVGFSPFDVTASHQVNQPSAPVNGCSYFSEIAPPAFGANGGTGTVKVTTSPACMAAALAAATNVTWIQLGGSSVVSGTRSFTVSPSLGAARVGSITVGGQSLQIVQEALLPAAGSGAGLRFVPVTPCRIMDTRDSGYGAVFGPPYLNANSIRPAPIPQSRCDIPSTARAYSVNLTVVPVGTLPYVTLSPSGQARPLVSTLNSFEGSVAANAAIVPAGVNGAIDLFAAGFTHVILDINGYFTDDSSRWTFYPVPPCRVADTRASSGFGGEFGPPSLEGNSTRNLTIPLGRCGIPSNAKAYSTNITAVPRGVLSFLTAWPAGQSRPLVSTLNSFEGRVVANAAIVPAGALGAITLYVSNPADVIVDINGYFAPDDGAGLSFVPVAPCRMADTRPAEGFTLSLGPPFLAAQQTRTMQFSASRCSVPATAGALSTNLTVVPLTGRLDFLTVWPGALARPLVSTVNSVDGRVVANAAVVAPGGNGDVNFFSSNATDLIVDINGYFTR
ncbi:MAG: SBBP repeat-containing protein [Bryobacteraceae bacterium]